MILVDSPEDADALVNFFFLAAIVLRLVVNSGVDNLERGIVVLRGIAQFSELVECFRSRCFCYFCCWTTPNNRNKSLIL